LAQFAARGIGYIAKWFQHHWAGEIELLTPIMTPLAPLFALLVAGSAIATPLYGRQQANVTTPSTSNATSSITPRTIYLDGGIPVTGYTNGQYNVSSFLGIPFATSERFRAPVLIDYAGNSTSGNTTSYARGINATAQGPACMQSPGLGRSLVNGTYTKGGVSEDCLGVNVFGPAGAGNGTKLPVVVWREFLFHFLFGCVVVVVVVILVGVNCQMAAVRKRRGCTSDDLWHRLHHTISR
jgi:hypothetical protein